MAAAPAAEKLIKQAAYASIAVATLLLLSKLVVWSMSDSTSVLSSMLDSLMDIVASVVNFIAIRYALMPADDDHPFGHNKAEGIAALLQAAFICGSITVLLLHVFDRLMNPRELAALPESIGVMVFSALITVALVLYQRWVDARTGSLAVKADSQHYLGDILTNLAAAVALIGTALGWLWLDPAVALLIALVLLKSVHEIIVLALDVLMDKALEPEQEAQLEQIIMEQPEVRGFHNLKTRQAGTKQFIQLDLELDGEQSLSDAHRTGHKVHDAIHAHFPQAEIIIHQEPV